MLGDLLVGVPLPGQREENELLDFDAVATILEEEVNNDDDQSRYRVVDGIPANIQCRIYPIESRDKVSPFATNREYTDKVLLQGFYPRCKSSQIVLVTRKSGEQAYFDIIDTEKDGDDRFTTLLAKARFDPH